MVRPYGIKGKKHKKRPRIEQENEVNREEEPFDSKEDLEQGGEEERREVDDAPKHGGGGANGAAAAAVDELPGLPIMPLARASKKPGVIFVLENATLEVGKVGKSFQLLNSDDHANFLKKHGQNPADYRPDIVHQALLAILDSPLTKAGRLEALYVSTAKGVLIEVEPCVRMPRTFKRFCGLMLQLLQTYSITATGTRQKLLKTIKNPVTDYLPVGSRKIGLSYSSEKKVQLRDYVAAASDDVDLVFAVGAMAHGKINNHYTDDFISISNYPLSAACCLSRICNALEQKWKIL